MSDKLFTTSSCGTQSKPETIRHTAHTTAINCAHDTATLRERLRLAFIEHGISTMPTHSIDHIISVAVAVMVTAMWEHSDEVATEYKKILAEVRK